VLYESGTSQEKNTQRQFNEVEAQKSSVGAKDATRLMNGFFAKPPR